MNDSSDKLEPSVRSRKKSIRRPVKAMLCGMLGVLVVWMVWPKDRLLSDLAVKSIDMRGWNDPRWLAGDKLLVFRATTPGLNTPQEAYELDPETGAAVALSGLTNQLRTWHKPALVHYYHLTRVLPDGKTLAVTYDLAYRPNATSPQKHDERTFLFPLQGSAKTELPFRGVTQLWWHPNGRSAFFRESRPHVVTKQRPKYATKNPVMQNYQDVEWEKRFGTFYPEEIPHMRTAAWTTLNKSVYGITAEGGLLCTNDETMSKQNCSCIITEAETKNDNRVLLTEYAMDSPDTILHENAVAYPPGWLSYYGLVRLSHKGDRLLWIFLKKTMSFSFPSGLPVPFQNVLAHAQPQTVSVWVSDTQGRHLRELGALTLTYGEDNGTHLIEFAEDLEWLPDDMRISFRYNDRLFIVPVP